MTDACRHRLVVEADAHPNVLLRLMEPFAIHEVLPTHMRVDGPADGRVDIVAPGTLVAEIAFAAAQAVAERLCARIGAMPAVRGSRLFSALDESELGVAA